ncbi:MAG: flagellar biosynthetic protein FliO [Bdellovibrionales bacterium]
MTDGNMESISWLRIAVAFISVFGLLALFGFVLKYVKMRGFAMPGLGNAATRRLEVVETLPLDPRRRLVIVRRDTAEHLLLLGVNEDVVVETNLDNTASAFQKKSSL